MNSDFIFEPGWVLEICLSTSVILLLGTFKLTQIVSCCVFKQCSHKEYVELADLEQKWKNLCLPIEKFKVLLQLDPCENKIEWIKFLALGCSMLGGVRTY